MVPPTPNQRKPFVHSLSSLYSKPSTVNFFQPKEFEVKEWKSFNRRCFICIHSLFIPLPISLSLSCACLYIASLHMLVNLKYRDNYNSNLSFVPAPLSTYEQWVSIMYSVHVDNIYLLCSTMSPVTNDNFKFTLLLCTLVRPHGTGLRNSCLKGQ